MINIQRRPKLDTARTAPGGGQPYHKRHRSDAGL